MKNTLRSAIFATTLLASTASGEFLNTQTAEATTSYICKDKSGGAIDASDFNVRAVQHAVGAVEDGNFGNDSCRKTVAKVIELGLVPSSATSINIGPKVLGALGINSEPTQPTTTGASESCTLQTSADIKSIQMAIGVAQDGSFGKQSCNGLISRLHSLGLLDKSTQSVTLTDSLAEQAGIDNDAADRAFCKKTGKCILVHAVLGKNKIEIYDNGVLIDTSLVNTGMEGMRTRNGNFSIGDEAFSGDGVHISRDDRGSLLPGRMGDPHKITGGQAFHWRVNYGNSVVGTKMSKDTAFPYDQWKPAYENNLYNGGFASHGCVHTPHWMLKEYDNDYFIRGVKVYIRDQPSN